MDVMTLMVEVLAGWSAEEGEVNCRERLGGLLRYYHREAA